MIRTFGLQTLTTASQPWFADTMTAAFLQPTQTTDGIIQVALASSTKWQQGDRVAIIDDTNGKDIVLVDRVVRDVPNTRTLLYVKSEGDAKLNSHPVNTVIALDVACGEVMIQMQDGTTGDMWIGTDSTVTNAGVGTAVFKISKTAAGTPTNTFRYTESLDLNSVRTSDGWIVGTTGDKYVAAAFVV